MAPDKKKILSLILAAAVAPLSPALSGCYAEAEPAVLTSGEVDVGYAPAYYDGYPVYYDDVGRPYYYVNGGVVWVSPSSPHYVGLVHHWHAYGGPAYHRWYRSEGYRYRSYRAAPGYHAYHGRSEGGRGGHRR